MIQKVNITVFLSKQHDTYVLYCFISDKDLMHDIALLRMDRPINEQDWDLNITETNNGKSHVNTICPICLPGKCPYLI